MLVDSDVLIWCSRGKRQAIELLDSLDGFFISSITYMELIQGAKNKQEVRNIQQDMKYYNVNIIHVNTNISRLASVVVEKYFHSHSLQLADALIGATSIVYNLPLITGNTKHFSVLEDDGLAIHPFCLTKPG